MKHLKLILTGKVQGVGFRSEAKDRAEALGITGYVVNEPGGTVQIEAEGTNEDLKVFYEWCKTGPELAEVKKIDEEWTDEFKDYLDFSIRV